jgi:hypothetical protein
MSSDQAPNDTPPPSVRVPFAERWPTYEPTPEEIEAACEEIQAAWSANERNKRTRSDLQRTPVRLQEVSIDVLLHGDPQRDAS